MPRHAELSARATQFPALHSTVYLNTGSAGPLLADAANAMIEAIAHERSAGRADEASWMRYLADRESVRAQFGEVLGADAANVALTQNTTQGITHVLWGLDWEPGDRILMTSLEHDSTIAAVHTVARRHALAVDIVECGLGADDQVLSALSAALDAGPTRLVVASHVAWSTGAVLPLARMALLCRAAGAALLVDGAQAVGNVDVDIERLGADFYACNGYKWLCGPEGTGALAVTARWAETLLPSTSGAFGVEPGTAVAGDPEAMRFRDGAARLEGGSSLRSQLPGQRASLQWWQGLERAGRGHASIAGTAARAAAQLEAEAGVTVRTPMGEQRSGIVSFEVSGEQAGMVHRLAEKGVIVRGIPGTRLIRVCCAAFVDDTDIDVLIDRLRG